MNSNKRGFTLIELLVVVAMIAILMGAVSMSFSAARERARIQKATAEVKVISQAILAYENWARNGQYALQEMNDVDADKSSLDFLLGQQAADSGGKIPVMLMAQLQNGQIRDPWGTPYKIKVTKKQLPTMGSGVSVRTGYYLPNFYRVGEK